MREAVDELGRLVAEASLVELTKRSFGAVDAVRFVTAIEAAANGDKHWIMKWSVESTGLATEVQLVLLPDFLETEPELLVSQFSALLIERALEDEAEE